MPRNSAFFELLKTIGITARIFGVVKNNNKDARTRQEFDLLKTIGEVTMPYLKAETENIKERVQFNTTIDAELAREFRNYCRETGIPLNILIEAFIESLLSGEIGFKVYKKKNGLKKDCRVEIIKEE